MPIKPYGAEVMLWSLVNLNTVALLGAAWTLGFCLLPAPGRAGTELAVRDHLLGGICMRGGSGEQRKGESSWCGKFNWKNLSTAPAEMEVAALFFLERERGGTGIDLSSLPISLKFQINKIHFSAPAPSPPQQTKEKQFPAVCSKLSSPSSAPFLPSPIREAFLPYQIFSVTISLTMYRQGMT